MQKPPFPWYSYISCPTTHSPKAATIVKRTNPKMEKVVLPLVAAPVLVLLVALAVAADPEPDSDVTIELDPPGINPVGC